ncbi:MAG: ABC transporter permease, partial [Marinobacter adhaerens]
MSIYSSVASNTMPNRVLPVLGCLALALVWLLDLGVIQPNRIVPGTGHGLISAVGGPWAGLVSLVLAGCVLLSFLPLRRRYLPLLGLVGLSLALLPLLLEIFAGRHLPEDAPYARSSIGAGFWCLLFLLSLMLIEILGRLGSGRGLQLMILAVIVGSWLWILRGGGLESLSLVREF